MARKRFYMRLLIIVCGTLLAYFFYQSFKNPPIVAIGNNSPLNTKTIKILHLDSSGRHGGSVSRKLSAQIVEKIKGNATVTYHDISKGLPFVDDTMISGYFTQADKRSDEQKRSLILSDQITKELLDHDVYVFGVPIYNFSMPASFKAWCDLAARAGITFNYTSTGPVGLLTGKKVYLAISSGGIKAGSPNDLLTPWLRSYFSLLGITDITIIAVDGLNQNPREILAKAESKLKALKVV
jgi:FMN-dependent NADH-azoreductase